jgi:predicted RNA binding protein YcfA (HicA-like mRNA interferase family)
MPKNIPSLKPRELIKILENGGCTFHRAGKGDRAIYIREIEEQKWIAPIDIGAK